MPKKRYVFYYPSSFGMGSNTDTLLVSENDLRRMIIREVGKKRGDHPDKADERLTGSCDWNGEQFCDSPDIEEVIADVIHKRLNSNTTYAQSNDLIPLQEDIPVYIKHERMENTVFHVWNQFDCARDIIAGETVFMRYFIDFTEHEGYNELERGVWHEFASFTMKRVLDNHYLWNRRDEVIKSEQNRLERIQQKADGTYNRPGDTYFDDLVTVSQNTYDRWKRESEATLEKFSKPVNANDIYLEHLYEDNLGRWWGPLMKKDLEDMKKTDFTQLAYTYPHSMEDIGEFRTEHREDSDYYRYDELFTKGADFEYVTASHIGSVKSKSGIKKICAVRALANVFCYD